MNAQTIANPVSVAGNVSILHSRAVLFRLFTSQFIGNPQDKSLIRDLEMKHNLMEDKRLSVRKKIMQGKELNAVSASLQRVRLTAEKLSAPWLDGGLRIVSSARMIEAKREIDAEIRKFEETVEAFISAYDEIIDRDRVALNGTFTLSNYPSKDTLRAKFGARLEIMPLPSVSDFRVDGVADAVCEQLREEMETATAQRVIDAKRDLLARVSAKVAHLSDKLANMTEKSRFHASTVTNIADACAEIRAANFDADPSIDTLAEKVETLISELNPDAISDDIGAQAKAQETARLAMAEIESAMAGFVC